MEGPLDSKADTSKCCGVGNFKNQPAKKEWASPRQGPPPPSPMAALSTPQEKLTRLSSAFPTHRHSQPPSSPSAPARAAKAPVPPAEVLADPDLPRPSRCIDPVPAAQRCASVGLCADPAPGLHFDRLVGSGPTGRCQRATPVSRAPTRSEHLVTAPALPRAAPHGAPTPPPTRA